MKTTERDGDCGHEARVANHQKTFNESRDGLKSQGFNRSLYLIHDGYPYDGYPYGCAYRGGMRRKCAVGWLIPDKLYSLSMEGHSLHVPPGLASALEELNHDLDLLAALQKAHDNGFCPESMESKLRETARLFGLAVPS